MCVSVLLTQNGEVLTFGSNSYGQLGVGDMLTRGGPVVVKLPGVATGIAAGSNHTAVLLANGQVYTFGSYQVGQCVVLMAKTILHYKLIVLLWTVNKI